MLSLSCQAHRQFHFSPEGFHYQLVPAGGLYANVWFLISYWEEKNAMCVLRLVRRESNDVLSLITSLSWDYSVPGTREADPVPTDFPAWGGGNNQRPQRTLCEGRGAVYEEGSPSPSPSSFWKEEKSQQPQRVRSAKGGGRVF